MLCMRSSEFQVQMRCMLSLDLMHLTSVPDIRYFGTSINNELTSVLRYRLPEGVRMS